MIRKSSAFTLVELSIVLVILGLLVGGVLVGQSLVRAAEIRSVITQSNNYKVALNVFKDKYFSLPGDMANATSFWGTAAAGASCATTVGTGTQTCNGDGNSILNDSAATSNEIFRFWQHLSNAGLIEGTYDGVTHGSNAYSATPANSPQGKIAGSEWYVVHFYGTFTGNASIFDGIYANSIGFGVHSVNDTPYNAVFSATELWNLDQKIDDGKPGLGEVVARDVAGFSGTHCTTATSSAQLSADYYFLKTQKLCTMFFPRI